MRKTAADRAYETALDSLCRALVAELQALPIATATSADVVAVMAAKPHDTPMRKRMLADAFQTLDEKPSHFGNGRHCQDWHALLRRTRNHSEHGPAMFALWD